MTSKVAAVSMPTPSTPEEFGSVGLEKRGDHGIELGDLLVELTDAVGQRGQRRLRCHGDRIGGACRSQSFGGGDELRSGQAFEAALS